jgi:threonine dehydrogenase-like Zn-dependent dehydrogenase
VFNLAGENIVPLPDGLPPERAVLAANMETALNATWDGEAGRRDRIAVVGAGCWAFGGAALRPDARARR